MNILSFDIEEWYTYQLFEKGGTGYYLPIINDYLYQTLDLLEQRKIKATFFCLGILAREYPEVVKAIHDRGHEVGCHSDKHKLLTSFTKEQFREDTRQALASLEQVTGEKVKYYRAPAFSVTSSNSWVLEVLEELGIECDCSIFSANRRRGGFPEMEVDQPALVNLGNNRIIKELPINLKDIGVGKLAYSGGGYFRLLPYQLLQRFFNESEYNMAYFHIKDFDAKQKKVISPRYFFAYYGIQGSFAKFKKLVQEYDFISVGQAIEAINWDKVETKNLVSAVS